MIPKISGPVFIQPNAPGYKWREQYCRGESNRSSSLDAPLPFGGIARRVKNSDHYDDLALNREIDRVWKSPGYGSPDAITESFVLERTVQYSPVSVPKLIDKFEPEPRFFTFIPLERRLDIGINRRLRFDSISGHFGFLVKRSRTSNAERAVEGSLRYRLSRASANAR